MASEGAGEGWLAMTDGLKLYTKSWRPSGSPKARLLFVHGFSDHCNCYDAFFQTLVNRGIVVHSYDQRGFGRSVHEPKQRGSTGTDQRVLDDLTAVIQHHLPNESSIPFFLMGHSMGGGEVLSYAANGPRDVLSHIRGFLLEAPLIELPPGAQPSKVTVALGTLLSKVLPNLQSVQKLDPGRMSRDPEVCREWSEDPLCHDTGTLQGLAVMLGRSADLRDGRLIVPEGVGEGGKTRLWLSHGTGDGVVSCDASRKYFDNLTIEDKEFKAYDGWYHKLHAELGDDKFRFANDVADWILHRCPASQEADDSSAARSKL